MSDLPTPSKNLAPFTEAELIKKCQENNWLKRGGVVFKEDPFMELDYEYSFGKYSSVEDLRTLFRHGGWSIRSGFIYENLCFVQQDNGGDEWWVIKKFPDGSLVGFESFSFSHMIKKVDHDPKIEHDVTFDEAIKRLLVNTKEQAERGEW